MLEIPLDKELTDNCLVETCTKLKELIPAVVVKYGLITVQPPCHACGCSSPVKWYFMEWCILCHSGQRTSVKLAEVAWNYKVRVA